MEFLGRILEIDLTNGTWEFRSSPDDLLLNFMGGRGMNVKFIWDHIPAGVDPLSPKNIITFSCGLLTGTEAPASARMHVNTLSPLTGALGSSNVGGGFGARLRSCGIQQIIVRGKSDSPVFLLIDDQGVKIEDAADLWGMDTWQTHDALEARYAGVPLKVMAIGPGGENGSLFGCIMTDYDHAAGRTGIGTVMGSKNLKAMVICYKKPATPSHRSLEKRDAIKNYARLIKNSPHYAGISSYGGAGYVKWADDLGILATRNYQDFHFHAAADIDGKHLLKNISRRRSCYRCPVGCKADLEFENPRFQGSRVVRPEFEPMLALGSKCGLEDLESLVYLDNLCSKLGLDSISAGGAIAFAMDIFERGIITTEDTDGLEITWGNDAIMEVLIRQMAACEGFGRVLSQGVRRAAAIIGRGADRYAPHVKGLELSGYHPNNIMGTALGYTVASRGADFNDVFATLEYKYTSPKKSNGGAPREKIDLKSIQGKADLVKRSMILTTVLDSLGICKIPPLCLICTYDLEAEADLAAAITQKPILAADLFIVGEKVVNLERLFNLRHGFDMHDDRLPDMFFEKDYNAGEAPSKPQAWMEPMKQEFYRIMGWDEMGRPTQQKLKSLGLDEMAQTTGV
jgi:aldehyde:ferredoxin oxidoreductase